MRLWLCAALVCGGVVHAAAAELSEAEQAIKNFRPAEGMQVELIASEPHLQNPVSFTIDNSGKIYVVETFRHSAVGAAFRLYEGVLDIRSHMDWLAEDLAARTVDDRVRLLQTKLRGHLDKMREQSERVKLLLDKDGDRKIDASKVFAEGFNRIEEGIAAGALARGNKIWLANIPNLWLLRDADADGVADTREAVHTGFGVHIAFLGHDLHGLKIGPDGKLYFSIGDRGLSVRTREGKRIELPDEGAVLRCNQDGSDLELFARGLRNPQELAFDAHGNLFTGDNNSDAGDRARWVYVTEGSDSGWRIGYQHLTAPPRRGPWNAERLWHPQWEGQAAYIVPPIANLGYGPSGVAFYPGVGLPDKYKNHFFLADFRGGASSGIHAFTVKEKGAGFEIESYEQFLWDALPTDVEFGPEPGLYYSDWVQGWNKTGKGRLYRVFNAEAQTMGAAAEVKDWLTKGFAKFSPAQLATMLSHADQRVRLEAQFELAHRGASESFERVLRDEAAGLARLHAVWGLGQIAPKQKQVIAPLRAALADGNPEVRAQAAKTLGEIRAFDAITEVRAALNDSHPRVQFFAAIALGKLIRRADSLSFEAAKALLAKNNDQDPQLRHAAVMALSRSEFETRLSRETRAASPAVRRGSVVALRRLESPAIAQYLGDADPTIALEAARAIHDVPISGAMPKLAKLIERRELLGSFPAETLLTERPQVGAVQSSLSDVVASTGWTTPAQQLFTRIIDANLRVGGRDEARAVAALAADNDTPIAIRVDAIQALAQWEQPSNIDRVTGLWRPVGAQKRAKIAGTVGPMLAELIASPEIAVANAAIKAVEQLKITNAGEALASLVHNESADGSLRAEALQAARASAPNTFSSLLQFALNSPNATLQSRALEFDAAIHPDKAVDRVRETLDSGDVRAKQKALAILGTIPIPQAEKALTELVDQLLAGSAPGELQLDILDAANKRGTPALLAKVQRFEEARPRDFVGAFPEVLHGGDPEAGKRIFFERAEFSCARCHTKDGEGGQAGPDLTGIGQRKNRAYILESIYFPNRQIAEGWENVVIFMHEGPSYAGVVKGEDDATLTIDSPEDGLVKLDKTKIRSRDRSLSAMPEEFRQMLTRQEARHLVEYLAR